MPTAINKSDAHFLAIWSPMDLNFLLIGTEGCDTTKNKSIDSRELFNVEKYTKNIWKGSNIRRLVVILCNFLE